MNDKDLSKPVAWMCDCDDDVEYNGHNEFSHAGKGEPLYSAEYVQSLRARIAELEREKTLADIPLLSVLDVVKERLRQGEKEGWTPEHDDQHENGEMAFAAASYACHAAAAMWDLEDFGTAYDSHPAPKNWPWDRSWWKPISPRRDLVRAGALILAEIDRLDRKEAGDQK